MITREAKPGEQPAVAATRKLRRTWWVVPYLCGAAAVFLVFGLVVVLRPAAKPVSHTSSAPRTTGPAVPLPAQMVTDALFKKLTGDLQAHNEQDFLSTVSPAVRPAVRTWWQNLQALGYSTGLVTPAGSNSVVDLDGHGNGTITVLAGVHNPLDPLDGKNQPLVACEKYLIGLHFATATATGQITSWHPLGNAPWDTGVQLYVRKAAHVVVAGPAGDSALVDETLPMAETAASYDVGLFNHVNASDLRQQGVVLFVSSDGTMRDSWFGGGGTVAGWPPGLLGVRTAVLPGATGDNTGIAGGVSSGSTGGARVVVTPYQNGNGTPRAETIGLVRDFAMDLLAAHDQEFINGIGLGPVPQWAAEGFGVAVQTLYARNTNPAPGRYDFGTLSTALRGLPGSYRRGHLPTAKQLFTGTTTAKEDWNDVAASVYEYIEQKYGPNQMLASAVLLYTNQGTPFGNVLAAHNGQTFSFYKASVVSAGWRKWLARL